MITVLIFAVLGLAIGLLNAFVDSYGEWFEYLIRGVVGIAVGACLGVMIAFIFPKDGEVYLLSTAKLESVRDNSVTTGDFILGCGTIDGTMKYSFYVKTNENEYQLRVINCGVATVSYTDGEPKIEAYGKRWIDSENNRKYTLGKKLVVEGAELSYRLYVPKGSIRQNFELDAQ